METQLKLNAFILLLFSSIFAINLQAQSEQKKKSTFVRIYNSEKVKISRGKLVSIDDSSIRLKRNKKDITIEVAEIGTIKTKRAFGNNVGLGAASGATVGIIIGFAQGDDALIGIDSGLDNALAVGTIGAFWGSIIGGLTALGKKPLIYEINGDPQKLRAFKQLFNANKQLESTFLEATQKSFDQYRSETKLQIAR